MNKSLVKRKTQMVVGTRQIPNLETGEMETVTVIDKNIDADFNFHKIWLADVLNVLNSFGNRKIRLITYLLAQMRNSDNTVSTGTLREIATDTGISYPTVQVTMKELEESNVIKKIKTGTYQFNPDIIMKGNSEKHRNLLIRYNFPDDEVVANKPYLTEKPVIEIEDKTPSLFGEIQ
mgnify:CR=1 FL=1